jgi:hypothetical protein
MSDTEIEQGQKEAGQAPGERKPTARDLLMQSVVEKRNAAMEREMAQSEIYDADAREAGLIYPEDEPEQSQPAPQAAPRPAAQRRAAAAPQQAALEAPAPAPQPAPQPHPQFRTIQGPDGNHWQVTEEQYTQLANMGMLANVALHQYQATPQPEAPAYQPPPAPVPPAVDPEQVRRVVREIQYGGEDAAAEALLSYTQGLLARVPAPVVAPQIDQNAIIQRAVQQTRAEAALERDKQIIQQEYPDIFAHPMRTAMARSAVEAIRARDIATGRQQSDLDIYREAGNMVRDAMGVPLRPGNGDESQAAPQAAPSTSVQPRQDVFERKRAAPRQTTRVDQRAPVPNDAPRAPTPSEIVDQMRRARGQASMR